MTNEFNQLGERLEVENETAILINSLRDIYRKVKSALKYGRGLVLVDATITTWKSKELELQLEGKNDEGLESLFSKGNNQLKKNHSNKN